MAQKKKPALSPQAAKILEQYRNAGKPQPSPNGDGTPGEGSDGSAARPTAPPPGAAIRPRSGTRGK